MTGPRGGRPLGHPRSIGVLPALGLFSLNFGAAATPDAARRIATLAEELGYESLWVGDHVVLPTPRVPPSPLDPEHPILDPLVALTFLAAHTSRLRLATGIVILPQRNPLVLAKQLASLDVVSGGRLIFGMGAGYLEPEMRAIGVPMAGRGTRAVEYLEAMRSLWEDPAPAFHGTHVDFSGVDAHPRPLQRPLPVVMGGHSTAAHRRAVSHADGWYGWYLDVARTESQLAALAREAAAADRDPAELEITISPRERLDEDVVRAYEELGVARLVVIPPFDLSLPELEEFVRANAPERVGAA